MIGGGYHAPRKARSGDKIVLPPEESRHALRVMRVAIGAEIQIVDGEGAWYLARIVDTGRGIVATEILRTKKDEGKPEHELILGVDLLKSAGRFEMFLEKAVELRVSTIIPLETEHTQRAVLNQKRCKSVMIAGLKQSMRSRLPLLTEIQSLETVVVLIGPEGGFSDAEIDLASAHGWEQISLGASRLRTETAAIAASAVIHMIKSKQNESDRAQD